MRIIVTGGAGFIGSAAVRCLIHHTDATVLNIDKLTYAANLTSLAEVQGDRRYHFAQADIGNREEMVRLFDSFDPDAVLHLAAESHVDRSIESADDFVQTNCVGTFCLLEVARRHWLKLPADRRKQFRFHHVSTDEVFGSLGETGRFTETTPYDPRSPYSASKAASDHLVRAWYHTFGLPVVLSNCSNNYGPYQFPEKLIPLMIIKGMAGEPLPVYGTGANVRDWLHVDDHVRALITVLRHGRIGESYNIGGNCERTNLEVVRAICALLDEFAPTSHGKPHDQLITFVQDRPGHDLRYAMDAGKIANEIGWAPQESFESGLSRTVRWYLDHADWWRPILSGRYRGERLGLSPASEDGRAATSSALG